jgi:hypothetical protein
LVDPGPACTTGTGAQRELEVVRISSVWTTCVVSPVLQRKSFAQSQINRLSLCVIDRTGTGEHHDHDLDQGECTLTRSVGQGHGSSSGHNSSSGAVHLARRHAVPLLLNPCNNPFGNSGAGSGYWRLPFWLADRFNQVGAGPETGQRVMKSGKSTRRRRRLLVHTLLHGASR